MTSKKNKKRKFTTSDFLVSSPPSQNSNDMPPRHFAQSPPSGPRVQIKRTAPSPRGGRDIQDDSRARRDQWGNQRGQEQYRRRSRSRSRSPYRAPRSRSPVRRGRERFPYENNYRPRYNRSPVEARDPRSYDSYSPPSARSFEETRYEPLPQSKSRPLEERIANSNPFARATQLSELKQPQVPAAIPNERALGLDQSRRSEIEAKDPARDLEVHELARQVPIAEVNGQAADPNQTLDQQQTVETEFNDQVSETSRPDVLETTLEDNASDCNLVPVLELDQEQNSKSSAMKNNSLVNATSGAVKATKVHAAHLQAQPQLASALTEMSSSNQTDEDVTLQLLGDKLFNLLNECADLSSLKSQQSSETQRLERRKAEYKKFQPQHDKFPSTKESQTSAMKDAERAYKKVSDQVKIKTVSLSKSAKEAAAYFVPSILGKEASQQSSKDEERLAKLERTCEGFAHLLEEQKKLLAQQRETNQQLEEKNKKIEKSHQELETKHAQLVERHDNDASSWREETKKFQTHAESKVGVDEVSKRVDGVKQLVDGLDKRVGELDKLPSRITRLQSTTVSEESFNGAINNANNNYVKVAADHKALVDRLAKQSDNDFEARLSKVESSTGVKITQPRAANAPKSLIERVFKLESLANLPKPPAQVDNYDLIKTHIEPLKQDVSKLKGISGQWTTLHGQVDKINNQLEKAPDLNDTSSRLSKLETLLGYQETNKSNDSIIHRLAKLENRTDTAESPTNEPTPSTLTHNTLDISSIQSRLTLLESSVSNIAPIDKRISEMGKEHKSHLACFDERVKLIESRPIGPMPDPPRIISDLDPFKSRLEKLEAALETETGPDLAKLDNGLTVVKKDVTDLQKRLTAVATQLTIQAPATPAQTSSAPTNTTLVPRIARVENDLQMVQGSLDALEGMVGDVVDDAVKHSTSELQTSIDLLRRDHETLGRESKEAIQNVVASVTNAAANGAINAINSQGFFARSDTVNQLQTTLNGVYASVESHDVAISNVQSRIDNINTAELHKAIVYNVIENLPNISHAEAKIAEIETSLTTLQAVEPRMNTKMGAIELSIANERQRVQSMRDEIDVTLAPAITKLQSSTKKLGEDVNALTSTYYKDQNTIVDNFTEVNEKVADLGEDIEKLQKTNASKAQNQTPTPAPAPAVQRPTAAASAAASQGPASRPQSTSTRSTPSAPPQGPASRTQPPPPNRVNSPANSVPSTSKGSTNANARPASRPGSVASTVSAVRKPSSITTDRPPIDRAVSESKKRPFPTTKQTNGTSGNQKTNGGPALKKQRRKYGELEPDDDLDKDPDFDPDDGNLVEPRISDSESDEPISPPKKSVSMSSSDKPKNGKPKKGVNMSISERVKMSVQEHEQQEEVKPMVAVLEKAGKGVVEKPKEKKQDFVDLVSDSE